MQHQIGKDISPVAPAGFNTPTTPHDPATTFCASSSIGLEPRDQMDQLLHFYIQLQQQMSPHNSEAEVQSAIMACYGRKVEEAAIFATVRSSSFHSLSVSTTVCWHFAYTESCGKWL